MLAQKWVHPSAHLHCLVAIDGDVDYRCTHTDRYVPVRTGMRAIMYSKRKYCNHTSHISARLLWNMHAFQIWMLSK